METVHKLFFKNSSRMDEIDSDSIDLIVTSPPYPMIEMWDSLFSKLNEKTQVALQDGAGLKAFNLMHAELEKVWREVVRVVKPGGIACINIGDATRKISNNFQLFPNHIRVTMFFQNNGFVVLPSILWRKPTNSPNKFLGSGMLPTNAYVSLEHEYILIFRKGDEKRKLPPAFENRYHSAYFWEERNKWFSDIWVDIKGVSQKMNNQNGNSEKLRGRSAAFPLKLPYRLINMFSIYGDTILDPFWGKGTTTFAAMISGRNSIGYEINSEFLESFKIDLKELKSTTQAINSKRIKEHIDFIKTYKKKGKDPKYKAKNYEFSVITKQETEILLYSIKEYRKSENKFTVLYNKFEFE
ncbi:MAG: site-specific DNA-methyltransferase [Candidatus Lokiarchaeota archaeon]|nr:site-specific DNA-methyltransferase [Candidatus Lokiarchaeota archaeon]